ncbi:MAG: TetR/AcrR family transcriptional regulator [Anaerolineales bacterium]|uniref:TetR/AcrR family transcriptional regulator n=1 Tax=Candidatus Villigracilis proximus TaxID=3140683 RepID=UPI0031355B64|nr:TetR/AcrR family transcriptional regulator [Anaerolineales bacterium]
MKKQRATNEEDKLEKRQVILTAAMQTFKNTSYSEVTMAAVALKAKLAKGTLFLYFPTKEEMFLALMEDQLIEWFDAVDMELDSLKAKSSISKIASLVADSLQERAEFTRLLAIHSTILEQNVSYESIFKHKQIILQKLAGTGAKLERSLPFLKAGEGAHVILQCQALVVGLWHLTDPSPIARKVIEKEGLSAFDLDFNSEFQNILTSLLYGIEQQSKS